MAAVITIRFTGDNQAEGATRGVERGLRQVGDAADDVGRRGRSMGQILTGALREIGAMGVRAAMEAAQAMGKFIADSVSAAGDFEAGINGLAAVAGDSLAEAGISFDDVSAKALQLGADTQFSAQQALTAMTELVKGGVSVTEVMGGATDATLALASAGGVELANAAEIMAKQLGVWGETGITAAQTADLLTQAANASTVGVEELAMGLAQAGGTARTMGMEYADLVTTMAMIAPNFQSAADAGTSFKTFMSRLIPTTGPATEAMIALGLATEDGKSKFFDATGAFIGMEAAATLLQERTAGLTEEERLLAFQTIFGADAIRAADAIARSGGEGFRQMGADMTAAGGAAEASAIKNQGFNFAMETLKGSVETLQIVIGTALLPTLTNLITQFTTGVNTAMTFIDAFLRLAPAISESTNPIQTFVNVLAVAASAAIPGAGAAILAFWNNLQTGAQGVGATMTWFQGLISTIFPAIQSVVTSVLTTIQTFWAANGAQIMATAMATWTQVQTIVTTVVQIVSALLVKLAAFITANQSTIQFVFTNVWNVIQGVITTVMAAIEVIVRTALALITGDWNSQLDAIHAAGARIFQGILTTITGILELIAARFGTSLDGIVATWQSNFAKFAAIAGPYMEQASGAITSAINAISGAFDSIKGAIDSAIGMIKKFADAAGSIKMPNLGGGGGGGSIPGRASGGPVLGGQMYVVGERGPELFIPSSSGQIIPNGNTTNTTNNYYNYSASYSRTPRSPRQDFTTMQALAGVP